MTVNLKKVKLKKKGRKRRAFPGEQGLCTEVGIATEANRTCPDLAMGTGRTIGYHPEHFLLGRVSSIKNLNGNGITQLILE